MNIKFFKFDKRPDETKYPSSAEVTAATSFDCTLKGATSIINPVIILATELNPISWNYAYIPLWNRFYFVDNWVSDHGRWECSLSVDVLASYKNSILNSTQYVNRSASEFDGDIADSYYPCKNVVENHKYTISNPLDDFSSPATTDYFYVVQTSGGNTAVSAGMGMCGVNTYAMTSSQLNNFVTWLNKRFPDEIFSSLDVLENTVKAFVNPFQYVRSCKMFPIKLNSIATSTAGPIQYGYWDSSSDSTVVGVQLSSSKVTKTGTIELTATNHLKHPQAEDRGNYLNFSPYTTIEMQLEPFGNIPLDSALLASNSKLFYKITIDVISGESVIQFKTGNSGDFDSSSGPIIGTYKSNTSIEVPLYHHQYGADWLLGTVNNAHSTARGYVGGQVQAYNDVLGGMTSGMGTFGLIGGVAQGALDQIDAKNTMFNGVVNGLKNNVRSPEYLGAVGTHLWRFLPCQMSSKFSILVDEDNEHNGRPLCQIKVLNTLSGYTQCNNAAFDSAGTQEENVRIENFLNSGFYIS